MIYCGNNYLVMAESNQTILDFIEEYRSYPELWDCKNKGYTNKVKRNDAYQKLSEHFQMDVNTVKAKIKSLRSYFSKEFRKVSIVKSGSGSDTKYKSNWFAFDALMFISDTALPKTTKDTMMETTLSNDDDDEEIISIEVSNHLIALH